MVNKKHLIAIDLVLVVGSLLVVALLVGYSQPLVIAPLDDTVTTDTFVLFEFEKAEAILIDDNLGFTSPEEIFVEDDFVINLKPGIYYWKIEGVFSSDIRKLTIESEIDLKIKENKGADRYEVVNFGNTRLNVDVYENEEFSESVILGVDESDEVSGTKFIGSEDGGEDE